MRWLRARGLISPAENLNLIEASSSEKKSIGKSRRVSYADEFKDESLKVFGNGKSFVAIEPSEITEFHCTITT